MFGPDLIKDSEEKVKLIRVRLKVAHFIPMKTTHTSAKLAKIYMTMIVCLHGVPMTIVSDRGT